MQPLGGDYVGMTDDKAAKPAVVGNQLGTMFGVYVPTVLSIIGIIWFVRFGFLVGEFGVLLTYAM